MSMTKMQQGARPESSLSNKEQIAALEEELAAAKILLGVSD